ncbi:carbamoyltransferase C-terminal domain-containing protein [Thermoproteota archaeon]
MIILGISGLDIDTTASIVRDGKIIAAVSEERISRKKHQSGFPTRSIESVLNITGVKSQDIDCVAYPFFSYKKEISLIWGNYLRSLPDSLSLLLSAYKSKTTKRLKEIGVPEGHFEDFERFQSKRYKSQGVLNFLKSVLSNYSGDLTLISNILHHYSYLDWVLQSSQIHLRCDMELMSNLKRMGLSGRVLKVDHHSCHAAAAFYTSGFDKALVVTLDGHGSGLTGSISIANESGITCIQKISYPNSLGLFYAQATAALGFITNHHEGKIVGLAAFGDPNLLSQVVQDKFRITDDEFSYVLPHDNTFVTRLAKRFPPEFVAAAYQNALEQVVVKLVSKHVKEHSIENVTLAGGVFANVKLNQRIFEIPGVNKVFIHPAMGDNGGGAGAALAISSQKGCRPYELENVFFGSFFSDKEIENALVKNSLKFIYDENIEIKIAELLSQKKVVARFDGGMEYGPRALGNRSILYHASDPLVNEWLNNNLKRTEFMPFAPATLFEQRHQCYKNIGKAEYAAEFMTVTFDCTDYMKKVSPAAVHVDGTARPQLVRSDKNPKFYKIIEEYYKLTGIPNIINTSFNMHEEPIVCTPDDAIRAFLQGHLDYLAIGNFLVKNPYTGDRQVKDDK